MKIMKKLAAVLLASSLFVGMSMVALAGKDPIDGGTPEDLKNRIETSTGLHIKPSIITDYHVWHYDAIVPISPKSYIDTLTGVATSQYSDSYSYFYLSDNYEYGSLAAQSLDIMMKALGAKRHDAVTINLKKYEGMCHKSIECTDGNLEFIWEIPKDLRNKDRDYAIARLNADGSVSVLTDSDTDSKTVTFATNYFKDCNLYCLIYGPKGCFDAYKPVVEVPVQ